VPYAVEADRASGAAGALAEQVVPSGAVVAFNLSACPAGWSPLSSAGGSTIIGVNPSGGNGLTQRNLGDTLGEEGHTMSVAEMPSHTHGVTDPGHSHTLGPQGAINQQGQPAVYESAGACGLTCTNPSFNIVFQATVTGIANAGIGVQAAGGGGSAFNNMQPSIALLYCQKNNRHPLGAGQQPERLSS
jgi:microcystin-dependent protein